MFVAGLELDLQILRDYRRAAVGLVCRRSRSPARSACASG
jgi:hypothetical protein